MKKFLSVILLLYFLFASKAQSFELMPGTERLFIDAQYLKFLDQNNKRSLFQSQENVYGLCSGFNQYWR